MKILSRESIFREHLFLYNCLQLPGEQRVGAGLVPGALRAVVHHQQEQARHPHAESHDPLRRREAVRTLLRVELVAGTNCIKIGLPGKPILSKRKGLWEVRFA